MNTTNRYLWIEQYQPCGCSSDAPRKKDLLGYCAQHGSERKIIYKIDRQKYHDENGNLVSKDES